MEKQLSYKEVTQLIEKVSEYGSILGLTSIRELVSRLGNPQAGLKIIHVAGTNGKGSVCTFLASILMEAGFSVARFSTPDVFCYEEKFQFNGENIEREQLCRLYAKVEEVCTQMAAEGLPHPTLFEMETAVAFLYAAAKRCDFFIVETGMGGRDDATNFIEKPLVSVITSISMDHMQFLGPTLEEIACAKAGIMKAGCPVVSAWQEELDVRKVIEQEAWQQKSHLVFCENPAQYQMENEGDSSFCWRNERFELATPARYQVQNAVLALETIKVIETKIQESFQVSVLKEGLKKANWPGRFTKIREIPDVYIDGAHNEGAVRELIKTVSALWDKKKHSGGRLVFLMGVFTDKEYQKMLRIAAALPAALITVTPPTKRGLPASQLAKEAGQYFREVHAASSVSQAVTWAVSMAGEQGLVIAFGSLSYLKLLR